MTQKTNKEILVSVLSKLENIQLETKKQAEAHFQLACDFSNFINQQNLRNAKIDDYLLSNPHTNQKGVVEQVKLNTENIKNLESNNKIEKAKSAAWGAAIGSVTTFLGKYFF